MDMFSFMVMLVALSQLIVGAGAYLISTGKQKNNALVGAGLIAVSTIPLFAFIDLKEIEKNLFVFVVIASLWIFAIFVALKAILTQETIGGEEWNQ